MLTRSSLILLDSIGRSPLKLLSEMDRGLRALERRAAADPTDTHAQQRAGHEKRRAGPPDKEHNWRFNGKGWFTRPQWNGGKCPSGSKATQHNTCIGDDDPDKHQYNTKSPEEMEPENKVSWDHDANPASDRWTKRAEIARTPEVENSPIYSKKGSKINWDHPHGPRIYEPHDNETPRALPHSPEHIGHAFTQGNPGIGRYGRERQAERDRIVNHYTDRGYDEKYVRSTLSGREKNSDISGLSDADVERIPDRKTTLRAAKRKRVIDQRQRDVEAADREAQRAARLANGDDDDLDRYHYADYDDYDDDYDYDDRRFDYDDYDDDSAPVIGGYENHPGYPGHPDYPQFDGSSAEHEKDTQERASARQQDRDRYHARFTRQGRGDRQASRPEPDTSPGEFSGPAGRGEPRWARTGQRKDPQGGGADDNPQSGRNRGSNRTSHRPHEGGGRGRTNSRRRGGRRAPGGGRESGN
jgi:hypothetical protein